MSGSRSTRPEGDLGAIRDGDLAVFVAHLDPWVDRMHDVSQNIVGTAEDAAVVAHDVVQSLWERRGELGADELIRDSLLLATRQQSLDHLAARGWNSPDTDSPAGAQYDSAATRYRVTLAHAAATVLGANNVSLLDLHFRHGVDAAALSDALGIAGPAAPQRLAQLRSELDETIAAYELWSGAGPRCPGLGDATVFDATVFESVRRHRSTCAECARTHRLLVNPAGLFLTAPTTTIAPALRQRVLAVASGPDVRSTSAVAASIWATTNDDTPDLGADLDPDLDPGPEASSAAAPDIDELWASTTSTAAVVRATPVARSVPVSPNRAPARPRTAAIVGGVVMSVAVLVGGVALAMRGSGDGDRIVVDRGSNSEQPPTSEEEPEPEVQSLGPVPPSTERRATTTTATSVADSTTTSSSSTPATEAPGTPTTTTGTRVATGVPPRPPSTPTSTVASSSVTTTTTTEPPAATSPPIAPPTATTVAPTTTSVTTPPATTTAPTTTTTPTTTTAPTTTEAPTTTDAPTTTAAP